MGTIVQKAGHFGQPDFCFIPEAVPSSTRNTEPDLEIAIRVRVSCAGWNEISARNRIRTSQIRVPKSGRALEHGNLGSNPCGAVRPDLDFAIRFRVSCAGWNGLSADTKQKIAHLPTETDFAASRAKIEFMRPPCLGFSLELALKCGHSAYTVSNP